MKITLPQFIPFFFSNLGSIPEQLVCHAASRRKKAKVVLISAFLRTIFLFLENLLLCGRVSVETLCGIVDRDRGRIPIGAFHL